MCFPTPRIMQAYAIVAPTDPAPTIAILVVRSDMLRENLADLVAKRAIALWHISIEGLSHRDDQNRLNFGPDRAGESGRSRRLCADHTGVSEPRVRLCVRDAERFSSGAGRRAGNVLHRIFESIQTEKPRCAARMASADRTSSVPSYFATFSAGGVFE